MVKHISQLLPVSARVVGFAAAASVFAAIMVAAPGQAAAQSRIEVKQQSRILTSGARTYVRRGGIRQAGPRRTGPRELTGKRLDYRYAPRRRDYSRAHVPTTARRFYHPRFQGYFSHRLPHLREGYYRFDIWPDFYTYKYDYAQPYTPYFSYYFTPFQKGRFSRHFQY